MDPSIEISWQSKEYLALVEDTISLVGKFAEMPRTTLGGFCTPNCWGRSDEIGSPNMILRQKASRGSTLANSYGLAWQGRHES